MKSHSLSHILYIPLIFSLSACGGSDEKPAAPPPIAAEEMQQKVLELCPLPQVAELKINTENGDTIRSKDEGYINSEFEFSGSKTTPGTEFASGRIRGRGNSTWNLSPKKPYTINLSKKTSLLGMAETKKWTLLANYGDKSMLRTAAAFCMARILDMPYTPDWEFVELTLNDVPQGLYQLTNKNYRLLDEIKDQSKSSNENPDVHELSDPFLLEIHWFLEREITFYSNLGIPLQFRSEPDEAHALRVIKWFDQFESIFTSTDDEKLLEKINQQMDAKSLIDLFLINELMGNHDAFLFSTYLFKLKNGLLTWGPPWDFDQSSGLTDITFETDAWMLPFRDPPFNAPLKYFEYLIKQPAFAKLLQERWEYLHQHVPALQWVLGQFAMSLDDAQRRNFEIWPILGEKVLTNFIAFDTYDQEVNYLIDWLGRRDRWIHTNIQDLPNFERTNFKNQPSKISKPH